MIKKTKYNFFDQKIQEITNRKVGLQDLMNQVNKHKLLVVEVIKFNNQPYLEIDSLWNVLYSTFNKAQDKCANFSLLDKLQDNKSEVWLSFSKAEFRNVICNCNNSFMPGPDKLLWHHLKIIINNSVCLSKIIDIANMCFSIGFWPSYFKTLTFIIIPKPNKEFYDSPKSFRPIVLLNTIGKLIEKIIGERLQFYAIVNDFIHFSQLGGLKK